MLLESPKKETGGKHCVIQSRRTSKAGGICAMGEEEAGQSSTFLRRLEKGQNILRFIFFPPRLTLSLIILLHQDRVRTACSPAHPGLGLIFVGGVISPEAVIMIQSLCAERVCTLVRGQIYVSICIPKPTHVQVLPATGVTVVVGLGCCYS